MVVGPRSSTWWADSRRCDCVSSRDTSRQATEESSVTMKDADEKKLLESIERGEWKAAAGSKRERVSYCHSDRATFRKDRWLNIRLSSKDLEAI